ncbi:MAG TPA: Hpt domain-containing protein [Tenuifilaceae bacterium]|nr:Hpt domain-containing protein [Tenuifilaceae bacterium]HPE18087.1 Hpt domain-containing protein [Tenuifilaceae bacterium]HPJ45457.1 Hpt domain-containing protein [Tenuifilaceae bacterium]HPQ34074.1 Hpt domain-containing protein [Tenuifilaceae bacterium]HRX68031.1 Hpt domain-containing protein [Tenuifilaceae bacterium]
MESYRFVDFNQIMEVADGSSQLVHDLINMFFKQVQTFSEQLDSLYQSGDFISLGKLAHKIKGSAAMMGITELANYMKELEHLAKEKLQVEKYPELINKYKTISAEAVEELKDIAKRI